MVPRPYPRRPLPGGAHGRRGAFSAAATAAVLLLVGVLALVAGIRGSDGPPQPAAAAQAETSAAPTPARRPAPTAASPTRSTAAATRGRPAPTTAARRPRAPRQPQIGQFLPPSPPTSLSIPSIGVRSANFVDLKVAADGRLDVPGTAQEVGFYADGPSPGQIGPAVLAAHVDSVKGPGMFYRLGAVKAGAKVHITRRDGAKLTFVVDKVAVYPKDQFPSDQVYTGDYRQAEIRLVTCGGPFDRVKHYLGNVVVFAHLTGAS